MNITYEPIFNGYPINTNKEKGIDCYTKVLAILQSKMKLMMESHTSYSS